MTGTTTFTAFDADRQISRGTRIDVALAVKDRQRQSPDASILIFDDTTGRQIDFDLRGSEREVSARLQDLEPPRGPGRPKLGVVAREVTLLPRHWDWLATQPGGASVTLRKLVEVARRVDAGDGDTRAAHSRAYHFMAAIAGNRPGFEEATRALFAGDGAHFARLIADWPADVRAHALRLAACPVPA